MTGKFKGSIGLVALAAATATLGKALAGHPGSYNLLMKTFSTHVSVAKDELTGNETLQRQDAPAEKDMVTINPHDYEIVQVDGDTDAIELRNKSNGSTLKLSLQELRNPDPGQKIEDSVRNISSDKLGEDPKTCSISFGAPAQPWSWVPASPAPDHVVNKAVQATGSTWYGGGQPSAPVNSDDLASLQQASSIATSARTNELVGAAVKEREQVQKSAQSDQRVLEQAYQGVSRQDLASSFDRSARELDKGAVEVLHAPGLDPSERTRFSLIYKNAADKARYAKEALTDPTDKSAYSNTAPPFSRTQKLTQAFETQNGAATTQDALSDRLALFYGLPPSGRAKVLPKLKLADSQAVAGSKDKLTLLHNGYVMGHTQTGMDCSRFISSILPADIRKGTLTTLDWRAVYIAAQTGSMPKKPPTWGKGREELIYKMKDSFQPIDIYMNPQLSLQAGDMLVYRLPWEAYGHVFLVKGYDPKSKTVRVIEAAQSAGTVRERNFPLSLTPVTRSIRPLRPGLFVLRLKETTPGVCTYDRHDHSAKKGGKG